MAHAHYEEWICYVRMPRLMELPENRLPQHGNEFKMFQDIENYAKLRIEAEWGIKGVDFNIAKVENVTD